MSSYELKIMKILKQEKVAFEREVTFKGLLSPKRKPLRFDFYILKNKEQIIIEIDGEFHFSKIYKHSTAEIEFQYRQEMDLRKNQFCLMNDIVLYRIPYTDISKVNSFSDMTNPKYRVKDKYHNHHLRRKLNQ